MHGVQFARNAERGCIHQPRVAVLGYLWDVRRAIRSNPERGCIGQPKVAVLGYLGNRGGMRCNPERVVTQVPGKGTYRITLSSDV
jgi:hypothetical protein